MDLSWIGTTLVALAGLFGVFFSSRSSARIALARQKFDAEESDANRARVERERIYDSVNHLSEQFLQAEYWTNYDTPDWDFGPPYEFDEHFPEWLEERREKMRQEIALIPDGAVRSGLQTCIEAITWAWGVAGATSRTAIELIREASQVGFELTTAWLRDQEPDDTVKLRLSNVDHALDAWKTARVRAEMEERYPTGEPPMG